MELEILEREEISSAAQHFSVDHTPANSPYFTVLEDEGRQFDETVDSRGYTQVGSSLIFAPEVQVDYPGGEARVILAKRKTNSTDILLTARTPKQEGVGLFEVDFMVWTSPLTPFNVQQGFQITLDLTSCIEMVSDFVVDKVFLITSFAMLRAHARALVKEASKDFKIALSITMDPMISGDKGTFYGYSRTAVRVARVQANKHEPRGVDISDDDDLSSGFSLLGL